MFYLPYYHFFLCSIGLDLGPSEKFEENVKKNRERTSQLFAFHFIKSENPIN